MILFRYIKIKIYSTVTSKQTRSLENGVVKSRAFLAVLPGVVVAFEKHQKNGRQKLCDASNSNIFKSFLKTSPPPISVQKFVYSGQL